MVMIASLPVSPRFLPHSHLCRLVFNVFIVILVIQVKIKLTQHRMAKLRFIGFKVIKIKFKDHYKYNFPEVEKKNHHPEGWTLPLNTTFPGIPDDDLLVPPLVRDSLKRDLKFSYL